MAEDNSEAVELQQQSTNNNAPLDTNPSKETDAGVGTQAAAGLRRSQRTRKLTEKGQELQESKSKRLQHRFRSAYDKWKAVAKEAKKELDRPLSSEILQDCTTKIQSASSDVKQAYEDIRQYITPDADTRRRVDTCDAVSRQLLDFAWNQQEEKDKGQGYKEQAYWTETGSVFLSAASQRSSSTSKFKVFKQGKHNVRTFKCVIFKETRSSSGASRYPSHLEGFTRSGT